MALEVLKLINITKRYGKVIALNRVSLEIPLNKITVVLGPSGSGKTTLLRIIAGLEEPDEGKVVIDSVDITSLPPWKRDVSMVFQYPNLFPHLNVYDNIAFGLEALNISSEERNSRVYWAAKLLKIEHLLNKYPDQLSGGEQQRVALARALVVKPRILLLDEPLSNLDLALREELRVELKSIQRRTGITFIHVTHDQDEALELADYLVVLYRGRIVDYGDPLRVYEEPASTEAAKVFGHNIIPVFSRDKIIYPWSKTSSSSNNIQGYLIIPQHRIRLLKECSNNKYSCIVKNKLLRRNYALILVECEGVILKIASTLDNAAQFTEGSRVCIEITKSKFIEIV